MRLIGQLNSESEARTFGDFLFAQDIDNSVEEESGAWAIWVHAEELVDPARQLLSEFRSAPEDRKYTKASRAARLKREEREEENEAARKRYFDRTDIISSRLLRLGTVTGSLIALSLIVTFATWIDRNLFSWFSIVPLPRSSAASLEASQLLTWQAWRWFTPMFIHSGVLHLLFNLWWLKDLGSLLEEHLGRWSFLGLVLLISGPANVAQYLFDGPAFGGMSGVVFGLLGYIWIRSRLDPFSGLYVDQTTVVIMGGWFLLCLMLPGIANVVHAVGLGIGLVAGSLASRRA